MNNEPLKKEGFWWSKYEPNLPMPVANKTPWEGQEEFIQALKCVEAKAEVIYYRGFSRCRICQLRPNGSREYHYNGWQWPQGFIHYIEEHNVQPSQEFREMLL